MLLSSLLSGYRVDWMYDYQGMVVLATNQVWWTWEVEDVFRKVKKGDKMAMKNYAKRLHSQIDDLVVQVWYCAVHTLASSGVHVSTCSYCTDIA